MSKELDKILASLEEGLDVLLEQEKAKILETIFSDIIYDFYTCNKYTLSHDYDPPYDYSGSLSKTNLPYCLEDYETIGEFLEEYTGDSMATYVSGWGMRYLDFASYYADEINERLCKIAYEFIEKLDSELFKTLAIDSGWQKEYERALRNHHEIYDIAIELADYYGYYDKTYEKQHEIMEEISKESFRYWHDRLCDSIPDRIREDKERERQEHEAKLLSIEEDKKVAAQIWGKLEILYRFE